MGCEVSVLREHRGLGRRESAALIKKAAALVLRAEGIEADCAVGVRLTDDEGIRRYNRDFRGVDRATDVLSFPLNELEPGAFDAAACERDLDTGRILLGDMVISVPRCEAQGEEFGHGYARELSYLTVHSMLHLLGYDHEDEGEEKRRMRGREKTIMGDKD